MLAFFCSNSFSFEKACTLHYFLIHKKFLFLKLINSCILMAIIQFLYLLRVCCKFLKCINCVTCYVMQCSKNCLSKIAPASIAVSCSAMSDSLKAEMLTSRIEQIEQSVFGKEVPTDLKDQPSVSSLIDREGKCQSRSRVGSAMLARKCQPLSEENFPTTRFGKSPCYFSFFLMKCLNI